MIHPSVKHTFISFVYPLFSIDVLVLQFSCEVSKLKSLQLYIANLPVFVKDRSRKTFNTELELFIIVSIAV